MLKYILPVLIALTFLACGSEEQNTQQTNQNPPTEQGQPQFEPNQQTADIEVSDEELEKFAEVSIAAQQIQMQSQQEMMTIIQEEELDVQTYNIIAESRFNGQSDDSLDVTEEQLEKFDSASTKVEDVQQRVEGEMMETIENEGMDTDRFMEINMALQQDQELQQRVQQIMMQNMQQQGQGQGMPQNQDQ
ncbi:DUF4168 domain-containing protein [Gracilimonas sp.]|uniref:DUF4168 domain-containing protein n=1 Tax=Gracilimonas sp. TaxID=1974203 RepID=UPI0028726481|nr:DUF4168 domain-containing protein [Gracilimonas sp.]